MCCGGFRGEMGTCQGCQGRGVRRTQRRGQIMAHVQLFTKSHVDVLSCLCCCVCPSYLIYVCYMFIVRCLCSCTVVYYHATTCISRIRTTKTVFHTFTQLLLRLFKVTC